MTNKPKIAGTRWESANVEFLSRWWPKIKRASLEGSNDVGDLTHPEDWAVECKTAKTINLPQFLREAEQEAKNKGARFFVALVKNRRGSPESGKVEDGYAVTRTRIWAEATREHERAVDALKHLGALTARRQAGRLTDSDYASLTALAVSDWMDDGG